MNKLLLRTSLMGVVVILLFSGCSTVRGFGAPIQERETGTEDRQINESGVSVTPYPGTAGDGTQRSPEQISGPPPEKPLPPNSAVIALLGTAGEQTRSGKLDGAAASLERALRIEPRNPEIWHRLAAVRLQQGQYDQAISLATKSSSLAGSNQDLITRNQQIITQARQRQTQRG